MPRKTAPSPEQTRVLDHLRAHGGILIRRPGGFWTTLEAIAETPVVDTRGDEVPAWWTGTRTVRAMEKKGLLVRAHRFPEEWRDDRQIPAPTQR